MAVTPNSGSEITLKEAKTLIENFKNKFPNEIKASFVGIDNVNLLLNQADCIGVRIYYGYNTDTDTISPVLVGVNSRGIDITAILIDELRPCPTECDVTSPLNN